ncbi:hypothetical protein Tco_1119360 [Tanacetum coccineum]
MPLLRILEVELYPTLLFEARSFRLSNNWIQALVEKDPVRCQVLQGREIELLVGTDTRYGIGTTRTINWCWCLVQYPHPAVRALGFLPEEGHGVICLNVFSNHHGLLQAKILGQNMSGQQSMEGETEDEASSVT